MFIIVGLRNPGDEYTNTRHNVGWIILADIMERHSFPTPTKSAKYSGELGEGVLFGTEVGILLPTTFMNNSGTAVVKYVKEKSSLNALIVVHDDVDLPLGEVRISFDRGSGGHNGIKSIIDSLGSQAFIRIRVGVAQKNIFGTVKRPTGDKRADFVLGTFKSGELKQMPKIAETVDRALELIVTKGKEVAMAEINR